MVTVLTNLEAFFYWQNLMNPPDVNAVIHASQRFQPIYKKTIYINGMARIAETLDSKGFRPKNIIPGRWPVSQKHIETPISQGF
jgi:hypothetical protein